MGFDENEGDGDLLMRLHRKNTNKGDEEKDDIERGIDTIDIWWLLDSGGLQVLIPYLLSLDQFWKSRCAKGNRPPVRLLLVLPDDEQSVGRVEMVATFKNMFDKFRFGWDPPVVVL